MLSSSLLYITSYRELGNKILLAIFNWLPFIYIYIYITYKLFWMAKYHTEEKYAGITLHDDFKVIIERCIEQRWN